MVHLEDVGDHGGDLDVTDDAGEEEVLEGVGQEGGERGEEQEQAGESPLVPPPGGQVGLQLGQGSVLQTGQPTYI